MVGSRASMCEMERGVESIRADLKAQKDTTRLSSGACHRIYPYITFSDGRLLTSRIHRVSQQQFLRGSLVATVHPARSGDDVMMRCCDA